MTTANAGAAMDPMRGILEAAADDRGAPFVSCGLNADWWMAAVGFAAGALITK